MKPIQSRLPSQHRHHLGHGCPALTKVSTQWSSASFSLLHGSHISLLWTVDFLVSWLRIKRGARFEDSLMWLDIFCCWVVWVYRVVVKQAISRTRLLQLVHCSGNSRTIVEIEKNFQMLPEWVDGWCWEDIVRKCFPDFYGSNWKGSAINSWQFEIVVCFSYTVNFLLSGNWLWRKSLTQTVDVDYG